MDDRSNISAPLIVGLCGSLRTNSRAREALRIALAGAAGGGARTILFDPAESPLPFCDGEGNEGDAAVAGFRELVTRADGLVLATPEYHGSYSGVLKNMLDLLSSSEMREKVCGLLSVLGGQGSSNALNHMRLALRAVHSWVIPHQAAVSNAEGAFGADGNLLDQRLHQRVEQVGADVLKYCVRLRHAPQLPAQSGDDVDLAGL